MNEQFIERFRHPQDAGNWFLNFHPLSKLNILFTLGLTAMFIKQWQYGFGLCAAFCVFSVIIGKGRPFFKAFGVLSVLFGLFTLVLRQFSVQGSIILFSVFGLFNVTWEAMLNGLNMASSLLGFSGAIVLFFLSTEMRDLMLALEKKGVSHTVSYIILASFQTMKDLKKNMEAIMESQRARGIETEGSLRIRIKAFFPVLGPLVLGAISNTEEKSIAMDARAFSAQNEHTYLRELRAAPAAEKCAVIVFDLFFIAAISLKLWTLLGH